ncbi:MAG TPA: hypothetical protein VFB62_18720, partial [Polyangiaceae bacterium]|nr:hypothetical protein [Polyangiaceae bacterium]
MLRSWRDYLPDREQEREVVAKAKEKAELTSRGLAAADDRTCAEALVEAAADAFRLFAITRSNENPSQRFSAAFDRARAGLDRDTTRRAIAGVLAFSSVVLSRGGDIQGHYDSATRDGLQREKTWLELATRLPSSDGDIDRLLGFAALAAGRDDLALALSNDEPLARLVAAVDGPPAEAREAFIAFLDAFPTAAHGYPELGFV